MKTSLALAAASLLTLAAHAQEKVTFATARAGEGSYASLYSPSVLRLAKIDSAKMAGGKALLTLPKGSVRGVYKIGYGKAQPYEVVLGGSDRFFMEPSASGKLATGGKEQEAFIALKTIEESTQKSFAKLQEQYNQMAKEGMTPPEQLSVTSKFRKKSDSLYTVQDKAFAEVAKKHKGTHAAKIAAYMLPAANEQEKTYFPGRPAEVADPEMAWPNVIQQKMVLWLQRYLPQDLEQYEKAALEAIDRAPEGGKYRDNLFAVTAMVFGGMDQEFLRPIATRWTKQFPNNRQAADLLAQLPPAQPEVGEMAPDIVLQDSSGKELALSTLRGKVVLIDFWASWCGPCRMENPNVVKTYDLYKDKGFTIYSVSLDQEKSRWLAAIGKDKLTWPNHVSDLKGWGSAGAKLYRVNSIPATFLIGKDGKIIAKNLRGPKLESELQKLIN